MLVFLTFKTGYSPYAFNVFQQVYDSNGKPIDGAYVDRNNDGSGSYKRYKKDSFGWYGKVIETNGDYLNEEA